MTPYDDADLVALLRARGALRGSEPLPGLANWRGQLAPTLCRLGRAAAPDVERVLAELERYARSCPRCSLRFCAVPGEDERMVSCPQCGNQWSMPGHPQGLPMACWTGGAIPMREPATEAGGSARRASNVGGKAPARSRSTAATLRDRSEGTDATLPDRSGPSRLSPSWGGTSVAGSSGLGPVAGAPRSLQPGDTVGPYIVIREMARGAMGIVLKCRHKEFKDRAVAVKIMQAHFAEEEDLERFRREGQALARVDHPNVVRVHDLSLMDDGRPYLALDFVEGHTLEDLVTDGPLPPEQVAGLLADVARGAAHLHRHNIVHRDLKLANVLIDPEGRPVIADFGLVHLQDRNTRLTEAGDLLGTPLYMPPEVILREDEGFDGRVDVYALGVMAYRMIVGEYPYYSKNHTELFTMILEADLELPPELPEDVKAVLERALARDPDDRYLNAEALAADLRALASGQEVTAHRATAEERLRRWARQNPRLAYRLPIGMVAALVLTLGLAIFVRDRTRRDLLAQLESQAVELDEVRRQLQGKDHATALSQFEGHRELAMASLVKGRRLGDQGSAAVSRLEEVLDHLEGARLRAKVLSALDASSGQPLSGAAMAALTKAERIAPPGPLAEETARAFEGQRAHILLAAGRAEEAAKQLAPAVAEDPRPTAGADWSSQPPQRRWTLAWAQARARHFREAEATLAPAPALLRAELALFEAACQEEPALRRGKLAEAEELSAGEELEARWLRTQGRWLGLDDRQPRNLIQLLPEVREVSDPPKLGVVPPGLQARACRVEGQLLLELGWYAEAAFAFERSLALVPQETVRAIRLPTALGHWVLSADAATVLGIAQARAALVDSGLAVETARRAYERLEVEPADALPAGLLLVDALDVAGRDSEADAVQTKLEELGGETTRAALSALRVRRQRRRGERSEAPTGHERFVVLGYAELAVCEGAHLLGKTAATREAAERARRAFRLALGQGDDPRSWAGLAVALLALDDLAGARDAAGRATQGEATSWEGLLARGVVRAKQGERGLAADDLCAALDALEARAFERPLERWAQQVWVMRLGEAFLAVGEPDGELLRFRQRVCQQAEKAKLIPNVRFKMAQATIAAASALQDADAEAEAEGYRDRAGNAQRHLNALQRKLDDATRGEEGKPVVLDSTHRRWVDEQMEISPTDNLHYHTYAIYFAVSGKTPSAFDVYALAHEMDAHACMRLLSGDVSRHKERNPTNAKWIMEAIRGALPRLLEDWPPFAGFPYARDDQLRFALAVIRNRMQGVELPALQILRGLTSAEALARRRPRLNSAAYLQGVLRLELGDRSGALEWLRRASLMPNPFSWPGTWVPDPHMAQVYETKALAQQRRWEEAGKAIEPALRYFDWTASIAEDPSFWEDRADPNSLAEPFVKAIDEIERRLAQQAEQQLQQMGH